MLRTLRRRGEHWSVEREQRSGAEGSALHLGFGRGITRPPITNEYGEGCSRSMMAGVIIAISWGRLIHDPLQSDPAEGGLILGALEVLVERRLECRTFRFAGGVDEERH